MEKIVIVTRKMVMGGIERALISMLELIPKDRYEVTVLLMGEGGELLDEIPDYVNVKLLYGTENNVLEKLVNFTKRGNFLSVIKAIWYTILAKMSTSKSNKELYYAKREPNHEEYDIAIAYHVPASLPVAYVMENIKAKRKIAWIHSDVSTYPTQQIMPYGKYYEKYDKIFCVSKYAMENFIEIFPRVKEKTSVFYNILNSGTMDKLAENDEGFKDDYEGLRILTVGRLSDEKGQGILPIILKRLKEEGFNVKWYCIGDGDKRTQIQSLVKEYSLEDDFVLLGTIRNPYNYIKQCDIYVQPSVHEGYCISLAEARAFYKPIVTTDFTGALEQIANGETGLIVKYDENEIYNAVKTLIKNKNLCSHFEQNLKKTSVNTTYEISKLLDMVV